MTLFADYTVTGEPTRLDADGNAFTPHAFNVGRAYLNVTGRVNRLVGFRITPDIVRESDAGSALNGSLTYRLKYAYLQFTLDDWMPRGSHARFGMQQTPWIGFIDEVYRYRFQGPTLEDREGILSSSDFGASMRYVFAGDYGDVHGGVYNGENYNRPEANDQKAWMVRATARPAPRHPVLRGVRLTGFYDRDAYVRDAERRRTVLAATFEHPNVHAGVNWVGTSDRTRAADPTLEGSGYSVWLTPKTAKGWGWEGLLRFDHLTEEQALGFAEGERTRTIAGIAYWFRQQGSVASAALVDFEQVRNRGHIPSQPDERRWALHALVTF